MSERALPTTFFRRRFQVPADIVEDFCAELWWGEPLGLEIRGETIDVYYDSDVVLDSQWSRWRAQGVVLSASDPIPDQDWLTPYRRASQGFGVAARFWVDPGEPSESSEAPGDRHLLRLPARRAFGTGSHESTRLAVAWLEQVPLTQRRVLDLGCGSGILSFAALVLGAGRVVGLECDLEAALIGGENRRLNRLWPACFVGRVDAFGPAAQFDVIVANVLFPQLRPDLARLLSLLAVDGDLLYSGAMMEQEPQVLKVLRQHGLEAVGVRTDGLWGAWRLRREVRA